jgi:hypothetical protein
MLTQEAACETAAAGLGAAHLRMVPISSGRIKPGWLAYKGKPAAKPTQPAKAPSAKPKEPPAPAAPKPAEPRPHKPEKKGH